MKKFALVLCLISTLLLQLADRKQQKAPLQLRKQDFLRHRRFRKRTETQKIPAIPKRLKQS